MVTSLPAALSRYGVVHDYRGPRMRLGVLWFGGILAALLVGPLGVAALFAGAAGLAALQIATRWNKRRVAVSPLVAGGGAGAIGLAALVNLRLVGLALIAFAAAALLLDRKARPVRPPTTVEQFRERLPQAAATLRSGLGVAFVAGAVVQVHRIDAMAFLFLAAIVCVYDAGDYLIGAGYDNRLAGPIAGCLAGLAVTISMAPLEPPPLVGSQVWVFGVLLTLLCPMGQLVGSALLPTNRAPAPALRRLDSWLLAAPAFLVGLWIAT